MHTVQAIELDVLLLYQLAVCLMAKTYTDPDELHTTMNEL